MEYLFIVTIEEMGPNLSIDEVDLAAQEQFNTLGKLDFSLNEETVDEFLGKDAYCGGDIPEDLLIKIEEKMNENQKPSYFWESQDLALSFEKFLVENGFKVQLKTEPKADWNESWRQSFQQINVTESLRVVPSWENEQDSPENIFIYPGMGFGTGNHETTFLCLKLFSEIKDLLNEGDTCLDFGCGSGILGIAAIKQLKAVVDFVDIDRDALDNCVANLEHNNFENYSNGHGILLRERFRPNQDYPLVFANILENILELEHDTIMKACRPGGYLIVSGLLDGQQENIVSCYKEFDCEKVDKKGDWVAILLKRKKA